MKIRTRFALFSIFLTAVIVFGTSFSALYFLKALVLKEIESSQLAVVQNLRKVCEESLETRDPVYAANYIESLNRTVRGIAYAAFVDLKDGLVLPPRDEVFFEAVGGEDAAYKHSPEGSKEILKLKSGKRILSYSQDVILRTKAGTAYLGFYEDKVEENIRDLIQKITRIIIYVSCGAFLFGLLVSLIFAVQFTRPINQLARGAKAIGEGDLDTHIQIDRKDEIGFLAEEFNTMAVKLKELDRLKDFLRRKLERSIDAARQIDRDSREHDQRHPIPDAALGDLLAEPHDETGSGRERQDGDRLEREPWVRDRRSHVVVHHLEVRRDDCSLNERQQDRSVTGVLRDLLSTLFAFLVEALERRNHHG